MNPASAYSKAHAQFDNKGFHAGTAPPFNLAQLASAGTAVPLGVPSTAYAAPYGQMLAQHHPQMALHGHHMQQDSASVSSQRPSQAAGPPKIPPGKPYNSTGYWAAN
ncbi:PREDICTED: ubiquitin-associated protein 2-like [Priapulus caudatus]|uniref:Ubiquitin-associated protein 2-like n=1 Tax=Priapulus caudatus TaxID=37621 RepID=A0ABM1EEE8_PRICU|nr:PREDICTED: ubiquitin-associated protein 2-like [Priapulus caudatus]